MSNSKSTPATLFDTDRILELTEKNLILAESKLSELSFCRGEKPQITGLSGWVFEQVIKTCLLRELRALKLRTAAEQQVRLMSRARVDLRVNKVLIEIKRAGLFGLDSVRKYRSYQRNAESLGYRYLFLTAGENYLPYRRAIQHALGAENVFFLDRPGHWRRFVATVAREIRQETVGAKHSRR